MSSKIEKAKTKRKEIHFFGFFLERGGGSSEREKGSGRLGTDSHGCSYFKQDAISMGGSANGFSGHWSRKEGGGGRSAPLPTVLCN